MITEKVIKGQKVLELNGGAVHYVEIDRDWFSVNGDHFDGHLGGIRWQVDLEMPSGAEDRELVAYLEKTRVKKYEIGLASRHLPTVKHCQVCQSYKDGLKIYGGQMACRECRNRLDGQSLKKAQISMFDDQPGLF